MSKADKLLAAVFALCAVLTLAIGCGGSMERGERSSRRAASRAESEQKAAPPAPERAEPAAEIRNRERSIEPPPLELRPLDVAPAPTVSKARSAPAPQKAAPKARVETHRVENRLSGKPVGQDLGPKDIQYLLKGLGFYDGPLDGTSGPRTKQAIKDFQESCGLKPDGVIGSRTREQLLEKTRGKYEKEFQSGKR